VCALDPGRKGVQTNKPWSGWGPPATWRVEKRRESSQLWSGSVRTLDDGSEELNIEKERGQIRSDPVAIGPDHGTGLSPDAFTLSRTLLESFEL